MGQGSTPCSSRIEGGQAISQKKILDLPRPSIPSHSSQSKSQSPVANPQSSRSSLSSRLLREKKREARSACSKQAIHSKHHCPVHSSRSTVHRPVLRLKRALVSFCLCRCLCLLPDLLIAQTPTAPFYPSLSRAAANKRTRTWNLELRAFPGVSSINHTISL